VSVSRPFLLLPLLSLSLLPSLPLSSLLPLSPSLWLRPRCSRLAGLPLTLSVPRYWIGGVLPWLREVECARRCATWSSEVAGVLRLLLSRAGRERALPGRGGARGGGDIRRALGLAAGASGGGSDPRSRTVV